MGLLAARFQQLPCITLPLEQYSRGRTGEQGRVALDVTTAWDPVARARSIAPPSPPGGLTIPHTPLLKRPLGGAGWLLHHARTSTPASLRPWASASLSSVVTGRWGDLAFPAVRP